MRDHQNKGGRRTIAALAGLGLAAAALPVAMSASAGEAPRVLPTAADGVIDSEVTAELADKDATAVWINLDSVPDLSAAESMSWDERGQYVYDTLRAHAEESQAEVVADLEAEGVEYETFWISNSVFVPDAEASLVTELARDSSVASIEPDFRLEEIDPIAETTVAAPLDGQALQTTWGLDFIKAPQIWSEYDQRGEGIVVGTFDTGVEADHPALVEKYRGTETGSDDYNWYDSTGGSTTPVDTNGHGTHVTGTMVGGTGTNEIGVAPDAQFIGSAGCCVNGADVVSTFEWFLAPTPVGGGTGDPAQRPHVINNSWGYSGTNSSLDSALNAWSSAGIFHTWASGNSGPSCNSVSSPAWNDSAAYVVANLTQDGSINDDPRGPSSRGPGEDGGPGPDGAAPGTDVLSAIPGGGYGEKTGTSMAAPHVAGAVALLWAEFPDLQGDIDGTVALLDQAAVDQPDTSCGGPDSNNETFGEGSLDLVALFEAAAG